MHTHPSYVLKEKETTPSTEKSSPCAEASSPRSKLPAAGCRCRSSRPSCAGRRPCLRPAGRWRTICCGTARGWTWCRLSTWAAARRWAPPPDRPNTGQRKQAEVRAAPSPVGEGASVKSLSRFFLSHLSHFVPNSSLSFSTDRLLPHFLPLLTYFPFSYVLPQWVRVHFSRCQFSVFNTQRVRLSAFSLAAMI